VQIGIFILIMTCVLSIAVFLIMQEDKYPEETEGKIINTPECVKRTQVNDKGKESSYFECTFEYEYTVDKKTYKGSNISRSSKTYAKDQTIKIHYNKEDPSSHVVGQPINARNIGFFMLAFAICMIILGLGYYYIVKNVRGMGTVHTAGTALSILRD